MDNRLLTRETRPMYGRAPIKPAAAQPSLRVGFLLAPDFTLVALAGFLDILRIAADEGDRSRQIHCSWAIMAPHSQPVRSSCGLEVLPTSNLIPPTSFDYVVMVGGLLESHARIPAAIMSYLREAATGGISLIGTCTGSFILARCGLMRGRRCCVHHHHVEQFQTEFPESEVDSASLFTVDGDRITCPGGGSAIDMALYLVERHCGRTRATKVLCELILEEMRRQNHPQSRISMDGLPFIRDSAVKRALLVMQKNVGVGNSISAMCSDIGVDVKTLERKFQASLGVSPRAFYRQMRIERARHLIERTQLPLSEIALQCGFSDASHLARTCREILGLRPTELRRAKNASP
jgi:transcriptional regulator GlxA family with amidase domain